MFLPGSTYYFVHEAHPAIHMLRASQDEVGAQLCAEGENDGQWYKVEVICSSSAVWALSLSLTVGLICEWGRWRPSCYA